LPTCKIGKVGQIAQSQRGGPNVNKLTVWAEGAFAMPFLTGDCILKTFCKLPAIPEKVVGR
jgi:hypothetical protein